MVKYLIINIMLLTGCSQLTNGQIQPVVTKNLKERIYYTTCSGAVENFASCNNKAMATCSNGYAIIEKFQDSNGAFRSLTFKCN